MKWLMMRLIDIEIKNRMNWEMIWEGWKEMGIIFLEFG
jgi:hypothetical protein